MQAILVREHLSILIADNLICKMEITTLHFFSFLLLMRACGGELLQVDQHECPTGLVPHLSNGTMTCECATDTFYIKCDKGSNSTKLLIQYCIAYDEVNNRTIVGKCPYSYHIRQNRSGSYVELPQNISELNEFMCGGLNRTGPLCGKCKPGFGPVVFSYSLQCMKCLDSGLGWLLYIFLAAFPTTFFFLIIVIFKIDIISGPMNAVIFGCQILMISLNVTRNIPIENIVSKPLQSLIYTTVTIYGIFNLDFFRYIIPPFCASSQLSVLQVVSLEYIIAFYPLFLIIIMYICIQLHTKDFKVIVYLWRPFQSCCASCNILKKWDPLESLIHAFVAFFLLSYSKILVTSLTLLKSNDLFNTTADIVRPTVVYYDASVKYFGTEHLPFALLAILVLAVFIVLPVLLLLLYQTRAFQLCLGCCNARWQLALRTFVDAFQGCYKDGTADTPDWRCFSGLYLLFRVMANVNSVFWENYMELLMATHLGLWSLLFGLLRPYKKTWLNIFDSVVLALFCFARVIQSHMVTNVSPILYTLAALPFLYITVYTTYKLLSRISRYATTRKLTTLTQTHVADDRSDADEFPDRVVHPEEYEQLLPATNYDGQDHEDRVLKETETFPVYDNSVQQYGSV